MMMLAVGLNKIEFKTANRPPVDRQANLGRLLVRLLAAGALAVLAAGLCLARYLHQATARLKLAVEAMLHVCHPAWYTALLQVCLQRIPVSLL